MRSSPSAGNLGGSIGGGPVGGRPAPRPGVREYAREELNGLAKAHLVCMAETDGTLGSCSSFTCPMQAGG